MRAGKLALGLVLIAGGACAPPVAVEPSPQPTLSTLPPASVPASADWVAVAALPPGAEMAILSGDPTQPAPFRVRIRVPNDYRIPPHTHPSPESVTVISGTLHIGMGSTFDMSGDLTELRAGQSTTLDAARPHFIHAAGDTVLELEAEGPWDIIYVNSADDPRNR